MPSGPTRGDATLDHIFTNADEFLLSDVAEIYPPLESEDGKISDHSCVFAAMKFPAARDFHWTKVTVRLRSERRDNEFWGELAGVD